MSTAARLAAADVDVASARRWATDADRAAVTATTRVVNVLVDGSGRLGPLSYLAPEGMDLRVGDAVEVPFGKRQGYGIVLGEGDPDKATREVDQCFGRRALPTEIAVAQLIARRHFTDPWRVVARLSPTSGKGADPIEDRDAVLAEDCPSADVADLREQDGSTDGSHVVRRFVARAPGQDPAAHAARLAQRLAGKGQVLVLCPTVALVRQVVANFESGARRIDTKAAQGAWRGFNDGSVRIGVGTRTAALYSAPDLAAIVVVEQDHPGHVEARMPNTHTRDVALLRSLLCDLDVHFTGAVPTPPALTAGVRLVEAADADGNPVGWPRMVLATRAGLQGRSRLFPPAAMSEVTAAPEGADPLVLVERHRAIHRCVRCGDRRWHEGCETAVDCGHRFGPCPGCDSDETRPVGWDKARLAKLFNGRARPVTLAELAEERGAGLVILFDASAPWRGQGLQPDVQAANAVATAATAAGPDGVVVVVADDDTSPTLQALCLQQSQRKLALHLWDQARQHRLPPFGRLVTIRVGRKKEPSVAGWPGTVLGPRRMGNEWEILVVIEPEQLDALYPHLERLRRPGKVRVTVT